MRSMDKGEETVDLVSLAARTLISSCQDCAHNECERVLCVASFLFRDKEVWANRRTGLVA